MAKLKTWSTSYGLWSLGLPETFSNGMLVGPKSTYSVRWTTRRGGPTGFLATKDSWHTDYPFGSSYIVENETTTSGVAKPLVELVYRSYHGMLHY